MARVGGVRVSSQAPWVQDRLIVGMVKTPTEDSQIVLIKVRNKKQIRVYRL